MRRQAVTEVWRRRAPGRSGHRAPVRARTLQVSLCLGVALALGPGAVGAPAARAATSDVAVAAGTGGFDQRWLVLAAVVVVGTALLLLQHRRNQQGQHRHHQREQVLTHLAWLLDDPGPPADPTQAETYASDVRCRSDRALAGLGELADTGSEEVRAAAARLAGRVERLTRIMLARLEGPNDPTELAARAAELRDRVRDGEAALRRALRRG